MKTFTINNRSVLLDDEDHAWVSKLKGWCITTQGRVQLRKMVNYKKSTYLLSRLITNCPNGLVVDHINGDPLDNQKVNLRICTQKQNLCNRTTKNKGVFLSNKKYKYYQVVIADRYFGTFKDKGQALDFAESKRKELFGEYAKVFDK